MRANPNHYPLLAPRTLAEALTLLADPHSRPTPIAGGTELMVAFNAGRLPPSPLLSLHYLHELRFLTEDNTGIHIGSATTFTDLRRSSIIARHLPLLAQAASWTGSVANQNRGTLGGNLVNASPAADSSPALLVYNATLTLVSATGFRTLPYTAFHLGYKSTALRPGELLHSIHVPHPAQHLHGYIRKVGTRNAQAISKVALAALAHIEDNLVTDIRLAAASLADRPLRLSATEQVLHNQTLTPDSIAHARAALLAETNPIDDIRSTAGYRAAVAANLLEEFLVSLRDRA